MSDKCNCCGNKQYSFWDHVFGKPEYDRAMARMEKNKERIIKNHEKLQAAAKESDEALIRAIEEL